MPVALGVAVLVADGWNVAVGEGDGLTDGVTVVVAVMVVVGAIVGVLAGTTVADRSGTVADGSGT